MIEVTPLPTEFQSEENYFAALVAGRGPVSVYLVNGVKLSGHLVNALEHCVFLKAQGRSACVSNTQMVFKTAISSVVPGQVDERRHGSGSLFRAAGVVSGE